MIRSAAVLSLCLSTFTARACYSGTEVAVYPNHTVWGFNFGDGFQGPYYMALLKGIYAWAVRDGDIAVGP